MTKYLAYFDDSGHPDDQMAVVVAGFISNTDKWLLFEREWKEILESIGIDVFHMTDFERCKIWSQQRKDQVLGRLIASIQIRTRFQISHVVLMDQYKKANEKYALEECVGAPYALAGRTAAKSINDWKREFMKDDDELLVFFEDGTKHKGDFIDAMRRDKLPCPGFLKKNSTAALQAADLLAWEAFEAIKSNKIRPSFERLLNQPFDSGAYCETDLEAMCKTIPVPLRSSLGPNAFIAFESSTKKRRKRTIN